MIVVRVVYLVIGAKVVSQEIVVNLVIRNVNQFVILAKVVTGFVKVVTQVVIVRAITNVNFVTVFVKGFVTVVKVVIVGVI